MKLFFLCLQNPSNGTYSARVRGLISTGTHMFPLSVLMAFYRNSQRGLDFFSSFLNIQTSIQTRHLLCDIMRCIFMGGTSFQSLISSWFHFSVGFNPRPWGWRLSQGLPKLYNMSWDDVNVIKHFRIKCHTIDKWTDLIVLVAEAIRLIERCQSLPWFFSITCQTTKLYYYFLLLRAVLFYYVQKGNQLKAPQMK